MCIRDSLWTLLLTFPGSKSYYSSYAMITVLVEPAAEAPTLALPEQVKLLIMALPVLVIIAIIIGVYNIYAIKRMKR